MMAMKPVTSNGVAALQAKGQLVKGPAAPTADELENWQQEIYELELSAALDLGFSVAALSTNLSDVVLLFGSTRYKDVTDEANGHVFRYGVAIRALVVVSAAKLDFSLTLPVIAAKVQLSAANASAQLLVQGYKGNLGQDLPGWQDFDVASYADYVEKVSKIQTDIMGDTPNIVPELIVTTAASPEGGAAQPSVAIGVIYALQAIAHGASLSHALDQFAADDRAARGAVRNTYAAQQLAEDDRAQPDDATRQRARARLLGYNLSRGIFNLNF